ncbi:nSTAND1 domain-containing NTPase [Lysobacter brunescens]|uniref:Winged helix-turn-helix domain-containing protein n=1 Tax=Lysobacter brunescens TaxID=262323 RepID=A0ABW2YE49_9GAMM
MTQRSDRIRSLASRGRFRIGALLVQPERLTIAIDGEEIALEPRMMEVLIALAEHAGEVVSAEQLLIEVWRGTFYGDNPVHKVIAQLRKLVGDDSRAPKYIETIRKRGYRLIATVSFPDDYRRGAQQGNAWTGGSPYVGLASFDDSHSDVFFGRSRMTAELLATVRNQIDSQRRFVLLVGASGCGKTSLLRAGMLPLLQQPGGFDGTQALSVAYCDLAGCNGGDLLPHLALALGTWSIESRQVFPPQRADTLATELLQRPEAIDATVQEAFRRHPDRSLAEHPRAHLLLIVDHAEALVAAPGIGDEERAAFATLLQRLCDCARIMVVMVTRSDFYPKLIEAVPGIAERKAGDGHIDVLTPRPGEIAQIIRMPAILAGLGFEENPQTLARLDDVLRDAATQHPDALPLLQHTLQALYERRDENGTLTFSAYHEIGELEGALAHRAEEVFTSLPQDAQARLDAVLSQLIVIHPDSDSINARRVLWSSLPDDDARALVESFVKARLFVSELSDGIPGFRVAHEALLRQWPRARDWAGDNRRLLQAHARLRHATRRWAEEGRRQDHLLNAGRPLIEATEAAQRLPGMLGDDERALLGASQRHHRRGKRIRTAAVAMLSLLALTSSALALWAVTAQKEAELRREEAFQLTDFMLVELADKLRPLGNLKLLDSISAKALAQLAQRPEQRMRTEDLINTSRALRTLGEVMLEQSKLEDAESAFVRANAAAAAALRRTPDSVDALEESGLAGYWLGYYRYRQKRFSDAQAHWATYLDATRRLLERTPGDPHRQLEHSYALNNFGTLAQDQGRTREAIEFFRRSAALKKQAIAARPDDDGLRYELIDTLSWISTGEETLGQFDDAAAGYSEQIALLRGMLTRNPEARAWERQLAIRLRSSAQLLGILRRTDEARAQAREGIDRLSRLIRSDASNQGWRRDLAHAYLEAAEVELLAGNDPAARPLLAQAQVHLQSAQARSARLPAWQRLDALIRFRLAWLDGDMRGMSRAAGDLRALLDQAPDDMSGLRAFARLGIELARTFADMGDTAAASRQAEDLITRLRASATASSDPKILAPWIEAHQLLGRDAAVIDARRRLEERGIAVANGWPVPVAARATN